jgi:hypothetical protein
MAREGRGIVSEISMGRDLCLVFDATSIARKGKMKVTSYS